MRADARQRYRKAIELSYWLLSVLPEESRRCYFCKKGILLYLRSRRTKPWDITIHHIHEDREDACYAVWPLCPHDKALAHDKCHRAHHLSERRKWHVPTVAKGSGVVSKTRQQQRVKPRPRVGVAVAAPSRTRGTWSDTRGTTGTWTAGALITSYVRG